MTPSSMTESIAKIQPTYFNGAALSPTLLNSNSVQKSEPINVRAPKHSPGSKPFFVRKSSPPAKLRVSLPSDSETKQYETINSQTMDETFQQYDKMIKEIMRSPPSSPNSLSNSLSEIDSSMLDSGILEEDDEPEVKIDTTDIDFTSFNDICCHSKVVKDKGVIICDDCGAELYEEISHEQDWRYFGDQDSRNSKDPSRCQWRKSPEKGIKKELERLGFPPDICELADELYMMITNGEIKRSDLRKGIQFSCVFEAYKIKKRPKTPDDLQGKFFGLDRKIMSQGITYYRLRCPRAYFQYEDISAKHFIPTIMKMKQFNCSDEHVGHVVQLYEMIKDSCSVLNRSNPQSTTKALIYYYFRRKGCLISASRFGRIVGLSDIIVIRLSSEISRVLGTSKLVSLT